MCQQRWWILFCICRIGASFWGTIPIFSEAKFQNYNGTWAFFFTKPNLPDVPTKNRQVLGPSLNFKGQKNKKFTVAPNDTYGKLWDCYAKSPANGDSSS